MSRSVQSSETGTRHKIGTILQTLYHLIFAGLVCGALLAELSTEIFTSLTAPISTTLSKLFPGIAPHQWIYVAFGLIFILGGVQTTFFRTPQQKEANDVYQILQAARDELEHAGLGKSDAAKDIDRKLRELRGTD